MENCEHLSFQGLCVKACPSHTVEYKRVCLHKCKPFQLMSDGVCTYAFPLWMVITLSSVCGVLIIALCIALIVCKARRSKAHADMEPQKQEETGNLGSSTVCFEEKEQSVDKITVQKYESTPEPKPKSILKNREYRSPIRERKSLQQKHKKQIAQQMRSSDYLSTRMRPPQNKTVRKTGLTSSTISTENDQVRPRIIPTTPEKRPGRKFVIESVE